MSCVTLTGSPSTLIQSSTVVVTNLATITGSPTTFVTSTASATVVCPTALPCSPAPSGSSSSACPAAPTCSTSTVLVPVTSIVAGSVQVVTQTSASVQVQTVVNPGPVSTSCTTSSTSTSSTTSSTSSTSSPSPSSTSSTSTSLSVTTTPNVLAPTSSNPETTSTPTFSTITSYSTVIVTNIDGGLSTSTAVITKPTLLHGDSGSSSSSLNSGAIAGAVVGSVVGVLALLALLLILRRKGFFSRKDDDHLGDDYWQPAPHGAVGGTSGDDDDADGVDGESVRPSSYVGGAGMIMREKSVGSFASQRYRQSWYQNETTSDVPYSPTSPSSYGALNRRETKLSRRSSNGQMLSPPLSPSASSPQELASRRSLSRLDTVPRSSTTDRIGHASSLSRTSNFAARHSGSNVDSWYGQRPQSAGSEYSLGQSATYPAVGAAILPSPTSRRSTDLPKLRTALSGSGPASGSDESGTTPSTANIATPYSAASFFSYVNHLPSNAVGSSAALHTPASTQLPTPGLSSENDSECLAPPKRPPGITRTYSGDSLVMPSQFLGARVANADDPVSKTPALGAPAIPVVA